MLPSHGDRGEPDPTQRDVEPDFDEGAAPRAEVLELGAKLADVDVASVPGDDLTAQVSGFDADNAPQDVLRDAFGVARSA